MQRVLANSVERYEVQGFRKDGTRIVVEATGRAMMYRGRRVRVATLHDITERKQAEEGARRLIEEQALAAGSRRPALERLAARATRGGARSESPGRARRPRHPL